MDDSSVFYSILTNEELKTFPAPIVKFWKDLANKRGTELQTEKGTNYQYIFLDDSNVYGASKIYLALRQDKDGLAGEYYYWFNGQALTRDKMLRMLNLKAFV